VVWQRSGFRGSVKALGVCLPVAQRLLRPIDCLSKFHLSYEPIVPSLLHLSYFSFVLFYFLSEHRRRAFNHSK